MFEFNRQLIKYINTARTQPTNTSSTIYNHFKDNFYGTELHAYGKVIDTFQGLQALDDLTQFLTNKLPTHPLQHSKALDQAAQLIAEQKGQYGKTDNQSPKAIFETIHKFNANPDGKVGQLISLAASTPNQVSSYFLIDDGLASRKRRRMMLDPVYKYVGIGHAAHSQYQTITVILFAEILEQKENYNLQNERLAQQIKRQSESVLRQRQSTPYIQQKIRESQFY